MYIKYETVIILFDVVNIRFARILIESFFHKIYFEKALKKNHYSKNFNSNLLFERNLK